MPSEKELPIRSDAVERVDADGLASLLENRFNDIVGRWANRVQERLAPGPRSRTELKNHIDDYLRDVIDALRHQPSSTPAAARDGKNHGGQRFRIGFDIQALIREYGVLRDCVLDVIEESGGTVTLAELRVLTRVVGTGVAEGVAEYTRQRDAMLLAEQAARIDRMQQWFAKAPAAIAHLIGNDHVFEFVNEACVQLAPGRHFLGRAFADVFFDLNPEFSCWLDRVFTSGEVVVAKAAEAHWDRDADGVVEDAFFNLALHPTRDGDGRIEGVFVHAVEVTDLVRARNAANAAMLETERESAHLATLVENLPSAVALVDAPSGRTLLANEKNGEFFRRVPDALDASGGFEARRRDGTPLASEDWPLMRSVRNGEIVRDEVIEIVRDDGSHAYVRVNSAPVRNRQGDIVAAVVICDDVTDAHEAQERLRFLARASDVLGESLDIDATLTSLAKLAVPTLADWCAVELAKEDGFTQLAVAHQDPEKAKAARDLRTRWPDASPGVKEVIASGKPALVGDVTDEMLRAWAKDDEQYEIARSLGLGSVITAPLTARGKTFGAMSLCSSRQRHRYTQADVDFTMEIAKRAAIAVDNARLYAEAHHAVVLRDDFLSIASHELRTPLAALELQVSAFRAAIEEGKPLNVTAQKLARIDTQLQRLNTLAGQLLDVSRLQGGGVRLEMNRVDVAAIAAEVLTRFDEQAARAHTEIVLQVRGRADGFFDGDRLDQVITNLVGNALKFGSGKRVEVVVDGEAPHAVVLRVADAGMGIAAVDQARIFERFERAVPSKHFGGLGLGLWIVKQIVDAHGGTVRVESEPGRGATFVVELPKEGEGVL